MDNIWGRGTFYEEHCKRTFKKQLAGKKGSNGRQGRISIRGVKQGKEVNYQWTPGGEESRGHWRDIGSHVSIKVRAARITEKEEEIVHMEKERVGRKRVGGIWGEGWISVVTLDIKEMGGERLEGGWEREVFFRGSCLGSWCPQEFLGESWVERPEKRWFFLS